MEAFAEPLVTQRRNVLYQSRCSLLAPAIRVVAFVVAVAIVVATAAGERRSSRMQVERVCRPVFTVALAALSWSWSHNIGWLCPAYGLAVLAALVLDALGNMALLEPPDFSADFLAYLVYMLAALAMGFAFWMPSVKTTYLNDASVDVAWSASPGRGARVPLHIVRLLPALVLVVALLITWRQSDWPDTQSRDVYTPAVCFMCCLTLTVWRGLGRIGYRVPCVTAVAPAPDPADAGSRVAPPRRPASILGSRTAGSVDKPDEWWSASDVIESPVWQVCGVIGFLMMCFGWLFHSYVRFWLPQNDRDPVWMNVLATVLDLLGQYLILLSIPCKIPPRGSLNDPKVLPRAFEGGSMRVLIPLPDHGFDVTQVAVAWFFLRRRGHDVVFATQTGAVAIADPASETGVLRCSQGPSTLVLEMHEEMMADPAFRHPLTWLAIEPDAYHGVVLTGGSARSQRPYLTAPVLQDKMAAFWELDRPVGAVGRGTLLLARSQRHATGRPLLSGCIATTYPRYMQHAVSLGMCCCLRRCGGDQLGADTVEQEVRMAVGDRGRFIRGPVNFSRGIPWDDRNAFIVEDGKLITARWGGDGYLFVRRFAAKLEEVHRLF